MSWLLRSLPIFLLLAVAVAHAEDAAYVQARQDMVDEVMQLAQDAAAETGQAVIGDSVVAAMQRTPRHRFVPDNLRDYAYRNRPLPIGYGQTISQPYIVALMTDLLAIRPGQRVLEVGTGSGYQASLLAEMGAEVYSLEIVEPLAKRAGVVLASLYPGRVKTRHGDGYYGWEEYAPFDAIIVTAAAGHVPPPLVSQLKAGGRMVIPVGASFFVQQLVLVEKDMDGHLSSREVTPVSFVPLTGGH